MSEQKVPRGVEKRIVIKFLVEENVPSAEIHHTLTPTTVWGRVSPTEKSVSYGDTLPHTVVGVCGEFQRTGRFLQRGI